METRNIDQTFHVIKVHRQNTTSGPYDVTNYFKAIESGQRLMLCGGYAGHLNAFTVNTYNDALRNYDSFLIVGGRDDAGAPRISPLPFLLANTPPGERVEDMKAACVLTEYPWKPAYAESKFYLHTAVGKRF